MPSQTVQPINPRNRKIRERKIIHTIQGTSNPHPLARTVKIGNWAVEERFRNIEEHIGIHVPGKGSDTYRRDWELKS